MCQISVVVVDDGGENVLMESVTELLVTDRGIRLLGLFDEPVERDGYEVGRIDFLSGKVFLRKQTINQQGWG